MFARKLRLEIHEQNASRPVPQDWLEHYFMRNFIGLSAFDETLVTGDGRLETGLGVKAAEVQERFAEWLRGRKMIGAGARLEVRAL